VNRKHLMMSVLIALVLLTVAFTPISSQQGVHHYDPWADINSDGKMDGKDIAFTAAGFGTLGDPTRNVNVTNWPSSMNVTLVHTYVSNFTERSLPASSTIWVDIPSAGFREVSLGIYCPNAITVHVWWYVDFIHHYEEQQFQSNPGYFVCKVLNVRGVWLTLQIDNVNEFPTYAFVEYYMTT